MSDRVKFGSIGWVDLTVPDAGAVQNFYREVIGWQASEIPMAGGSYSDFCMHPGATNESPVAGICHARGSNADLPSVWLIYINVENLAASLDRCVASGGTILSGPRSLGAHGSMAVIRDPAGACCALFEPPAST